MSTESISESLTSPSHDDYDDINLVHTFCVDSPRNIPEATVVCCGSDPSGEEVPSTKETTCPMCAEMAWLPEGYCACWKV